MLSNQEFFEVIKNAPLVAIDLVLKDDDGRILMGLRKNEPAKGTWFVPGGRVRKEETLDQAFERLTLDEIGIKMGRNQARFIGVFEHWYDTNALGISGVGTHYIVLAHEIRFSMMPEHLPNEQHNGYLWFSKDEALQPQVNMVVHQNNFPYF